MAFPWIFESNFEAGTNGEWDSESDTGSKLDFPHYSTLATIPGMGMPFSGAYCMRIQVGDTNDHVLVEGDIDIATGVTRWFRWAMYVSSDFAATADDNFSIFELQQAAGTQVYTVGATITAATGAITVWVGEADTPETTSTATLPRGRWFIVEVQANVDTAAANGDITVYLDGSSIVSLTTPVQNAAAVGRGVLGTQNTLATTTGTLLYDDFLMDDAQLGPVVDRFKQSAYLTKTSHVFVGPGCVTGISLVAGAATDNTITIYDTDTGYTTDQSNIVYTGGAAVASTTVDLLLKEKINVTRGAYVVLAGTTPRASVRFNGPVSLSEGAMRTFASRRTAGPHGA